METSTTQARQLKRGDITNGLVNWFQMTGTERRTRALLCCVMPPPLCSRSEGSEFPLSSTKIDLAQPLLCATLLRMVIIITAIKFSLYETNFRINRMRCETLRGSRRSPLPKT
ncbi:hypothetical protein JHK87_027557 [Glycine soja]|nr:hypothetical protein JHK87_027557 [Glycine soja]